MIAMYQINTAQRYQYLREMWNIRTSVIKKKLSAGSASRGCWTDDWLLPATCAELGRALGFFSSPPTAAAASSVSVCKRLLCIGGSGGHLTSGPLPTDADFDLCPDLLTGGSDPDTGGVADSGGGACMARSRSSMLQRGTRGTEPVTYNMPWV